MACHDRPPAAARRVCHRLIEGQRATRDVIARASDDDRLGRWTRRLRDAAPWRWAGSTRDCRRPSSTGCIGDQPALIENADLVGELMHLDDAPRAIGNAVVVAADRDEPVMADPALELEQGIEGQGRQGLQLRLLGGKGLRDDPLGRAVQTDIGDRVEPVAELGVEIVEIAEAAGQEEVLPDVAEGPLDLALRLGPIGPAGFGQEAVVLRQGEQRAVVDDVASPSSPVTAVFMRS